MDNTNLSLNADGVTIQGEHYTVSNGFLSKANGRVHILFKDLLSAEIVKRRSKKAMYVTLIIGCILIFALNYARNNFVPSAPEIRLDTVESVLDTYEAISGFIDDIDTFLYRDLRVILNVMIPIVAFLTIAAAVYLFSGKRFIEFVTMRGTYRVDTKNMGADADNVVRLVASRAQRR